METEKEHLENFILNNQELERLEGMLSDFNLFETLNMVNAEIRHSNILSWLLDPNKNHGLGSYFLNLFLKHFISENKNVVEGIDVFSMEMLNFANVEVRREWKNIDILVLIEEGNQKIAVTIENKVKSAEHSQQLFRYRQAVEEEFPEFQKLYIYLTPEASIPSDDFWNNFNYTTIAELIDQTLRYKKDQLNEQIITFIEQYNKILKRYIVGNSEVEQICKQIYKKHKTALDIIFQYKPDILSDISDYLQSMIRSSQDIRLDAAGKSSICFSTKVIDDKVPRISVGWLKSGRFLFYEFYNQQNRLALRLYIGPGNDVAKKQLLKEFAKDKELFTLAARTMRKTYHCVYQKEFLRGEDYETKEYDELVKIINSKWKGFLEKHRKEIDQFIAAINVDFIKDNSSK